MEGLKFYRPFIILQRNQYCTAPRYNKPIIKIPEYVKHELKKKLRLDGAKRLKEIQRKSKLGNPKVPIITCQNPNFNHNSGRVYSTNGEIPLASIGWSKTKSFGDYFIIHANGQNPSLHSEKSQKQSFEDFNLNPSVLEGIHKLGFTSPTVIQSQAIPSLLNGENVVCSAETGSGKTLAYLAPMLHNIMQMNEKYSIQAPKYSPSGLILVPGRELANQVGQICSTLSSVCGLGVKVITGGNSLKVKLSQELDGTDIVVATMGIMQKLVSTGAYSLKYVQQVVLDECDTMVDDTFIDPLLKLLKDVNIKGKNDDSDEDGDNSSLADGAQLALVGATIPNDLSTAFHDLLDSELLTWIRTPQVHKLMPHIKQTFLRMDAEKKIERLITIMKREFKSQVPCIIFCNRAPAAHYVSKSLSENEIPNGALHGDAPINERQQMFDAFQKGEINILVCTDLGSRGLDTTRVKHVINFEFPIHMSDYIHRAGRTGRVGTEGGKCTNFIGTKIEIPLVQQIERSARMMKILPNVNANIRRDIVEYISNKDKFRPRHRKRNLKLKALKY